MSKKRRGGDEPEMPEAVDPAEPGAEVAPTAEVTLSEERFNEFAAEEEFILSVTVNGFGKRSSAYEYRVTGRGGQGIANIDTSERNGAVIASFPVRNDDQIMLVTNGGQLLRIPVDDIRIAGRRTQGVVLFRVAEKESVVSVTRLGDDSGEAADKAEG
jgi:DNA gyrase subunit A